MVRIEVPNQFHAGTLHAVWAMVSQSKLNAENGPTEVVLDMANVNFVDSEGANYLALIPYFLKSGGAQVMIVLPESSTVLSFLENLGLLEHLYQQFKIVGRGKSGLQVERLESGLFKRHEQIINRFFKTYVFESREISELFRLEIIRHHLFDLEQETAGKVCACIFEVAKNIFEHSREITGCFTIQFRKNPAMKRVRRQEKPNQLLGQLFVAISDLGIGIKKSLLEGVEESNGPSKNASDQEFLSYAILPGTSRFGYGFRGSGLPSAIRLANNFHLSSGRGTLHINKKNPKATTKETVFLPGTSAMMIFNVGG